MANEVRDTVKIISEKLKRLRVESGYSSYESFAHDHNLDRKQYWRVENGANITLKTLVNILEIHKVSLKSFFSDI